MSESKPLEFSKEQKLIVRMLCEIHGALNIQDGVDPVLIERAVMTGNTWALDQEYNLDEGNVIEEEKVDFVSDVLDMYLVLNTSFSNLPQMEKDALAAIFSIKNYKDPAISFPGFDGNSESQYRSITFIMKTMEMYEDVDTLTANSHRRTVPGFKKMLSVLEKATSDSPKGGLLTFEGIHAVLSAE